MTGHPAGLVGIFGYGGWWAVPAALGVGLVLAAAFQGARWVLRETARRRALAVALPARTAAWPALPAMCCCTGRRRSRAAAPGAVLLADRAPVHRTRWALASVSRLKRAVTAPAAGRARFWASRPDQSARRTNEL